MDSQEKSPSGGDRNGASESFLEIGFWSKNNNKLVKRQALEMAENEWLWACRKAIQSSTAENLYIADSRKSAFKEAWGRIC